MKESVWTSNTKLPEYEKLCHGSRFEKDGKLIDNPANGNARIE